MYGLKAAKSTADGSESTKVHVISAHYTNYLSIFHFNHVVAFEMNFKTHFIPCLYLLEKLRYDTWCWLQGNSTSLILVKIHYKGLYGQEDRHLGG